MGNTVDYRLSDEQRMLQDMVKRVAAERYGFAVRRAAIAGSAGLHRPFWEELGRLGVLGAALPESCGGLGAGPVASMLIMSALGRHLVLSPYVSTVVCAAGLLARLGSEDQRRRHLPPILAGETIVAFACAEGGDDTGVEGIEMQAAPAGGGYRLQGHKGLVVGAVWSTQVLAVARLTGLESGLAAFLLPLDTPGIKAQHRRTVDGGSAAELRFDGVLAPSSCRIGSGDITQELDRIRDEAIAALCADAAGSMAALLDATTEYARTRKQFGKPIGSFQALQHRMVDMLVACEQAASISHHAALQLDAGPEQRRRAVSAAKALIGKLGRGVAQAAVQIHGGIGITEELDVSHHFRRLEMFNLQFGTSDQHLRRYSGLLDTGTAAQAA
jgi:alkylation response protein AidB-like acyl-CoA dehydrogenase